MRISSNYYERYLFSTFPWLLLSVIIFYPLKKTDITTLLIGMFIVSVIFSLIDKIPVWKIQLSNVRIEHDQLFINGQQRDATAIEKIKYYKTAAPQSMIVFEFHFKDNKEVTFMDRPKTVFYRSQNKLRSKSLDILFESFPFLKNRLKKKPY